MTISLVFNELSLRRLAPDRHTARVWMEELTGTLKTAVEHSVTRLRMREDFKDLVLALDYPMEAWFGDSLVPREEQLFLLTYATQYEYVRPYDDDLRGDERFQSKKMLFEGSFQGERAEGLSYTYLLNGLALSLLSESCWNSGSLELECKEMDPESLEVTCFSTIVNHVSRSGHVLVDHASWIDNRLKTGIRSGSDLVRRAAILFPNLVICKRAEAQLLGMTESSIYLPRILHRLAELESLANMWQVGAFDYEQLSNASRESPSTMSRFGDSRVFYCPDGQSRTFEWHLKGFPNAWRIHFFADSNVRKVLIGYIGKHLPTTKNPT